ncbi:MAG: hypothetical protein KGL34_05340 [Gammaproteobacteria bacterium]|nr:hypothetical protein [Gammaproteobacteria bacterium]
MPPITPATAWVYAAALVAAGAYVLHLGIRAWREERSLTDTPTGRIRSAAQGYARLQGRPEGGERGSLRAPLTGLPCSWWRYRIEERRSTGRSRSWVAVQSATCETPFLLDDGTGRCLIDPRGAEVHARAKDVWYGPDAWPQVRIPGGSGILGRIADTLITDRYRYVEQRLVSGEPLLVLGEFRTVGGVQPLELDDEVAALLHDWKTDQATLLARFDRDGDGRLSMAEWDQARGAARQQVLAERSARPPPPAIATLADPGDGRPFVIAAIGERRLEVDYRIRALAGAAGFVAAAAAAAWTLAHR